MGHQRFERGVLQLDRVRRILCDYDAGAGLRHFGAGQQRLDGRKL